MDHVACPPNRFYHRLCLWRPEIGQGRFREHGLQNIPVSRLQSGADGRGTDDLAANAFPRNDLKRNAAFGQLLFHDGVVPCGNGAGQFLSDKALADS